MSDIEEYFGKDFIDKINNIFEKAEEKNQFVFFHGVYSLDDAISIALNGLKCDYPELLYTAELMVKSDKLLFEKIKSWPHWNLKYLLTICVPKISGKGGLPIWNKEKSGQFSLSPKFIKGIIGVNNKSVISNPKYNLAENIVATVEDRSFEPITGKIIGVSVPPDEMELYEKSEERI